MTGDRKRLLNGFLDYIERQNGQLIIVGDLFELWKFRFEKVFIENIDLMDRFEQLAAVYVLGNHDQQLASFMNYENLPHPFLSRMCNSFVKTVGNRKFKFLHGHEVDPFITHQVQNWAPLISKFSGLIDYGACDCALQKETMYEFFLECGESFIALRDWIAKK